MIDFSLTSLNTDQPTLLSASYVMLMTFGLAATLAAVYHMTTARNASFGQFIQTMVLGAIGASVIVMAIGDNIGRGLGILGALAIIRFRTTLRQPRDIVFMFCALGIGMACGMYGFNIAVIGTISFSVFAILFRLSPYHAMRHTKYQLRINIPLNTEIGLIQIESILSKYFKRFILQRKDIVKDKKEESKEIQYLLGSECMDESAFIKELKLLHEELNVRYWMRNENASD